MSDYSMSRCTSLAERPTGALAAYNTVNSNTLTIAFMEFLQESDSNMMKSLWWSYGWQDISPIWGTRSRGPNRQPPPGCR